MSDSKQQWTKWEDARPAAEGIYRWRVPSRVVEGLSVSFLAKMRMRGAGYIDVLSPEFDRWDGYRVLVPAGIEWQQAEIESGRKLKGYEEVHIEGLVVACCPFCKQVPKLTGHQTSMYGVTINASPFNYNSWSMHCCAWAKTPSFSDPRVLASTHAELIAKAGT